MKAFLLGVFLMLMAGAWRSSAHIGNPTTIHEGVAGGIPVRVSVRVPTVVPGLADIYVRVLTNAAVRQVSALPVHWKTGLSGSPPADICRPVPEEANLYHAQLWLMAYGAYSVNVAIESERGSGKIVVPINSLATTRLPMPKYLGALLLGLGVFLFALAVTAAGAALRESSLAPGLAPSRKRIWIGRAGIVGATAILSFSLYGGWNWWQAEDSDYRNNRMHKPLPVRADVFPDEGGQKIRIRVKSSNASASSTNGGWPLLVPDHGKLMHLFLVREPDMAAFAHLHPARRGTNRFESTLPPLPAGIYSVYADVTYENGLAQTLTATAEIAGGETNAVSGGALSDPDDSWRTSEPGNSAGPRILWDRPESLVAGREISLRFRALETNGEPADLEPYISMLAHAIVRRADGSVFTHLHPAGTISLAAQQVFQIRSGDKPPRRITPEMMEKLCQPPGPELRRAPIAFPYEFPKAGQYRIWVQIKTGGMVRTEVFDANVQPAG